MKSIGAAAGQDIRTNLDIMIIIEFLASTNRTSSNNKSGVQAYTNYQYGPATVEVGTVSCARVWIVAMCP